MPAVLGALLLVGALSAADAGAVATPVEAILCGCLGIAFAVVLDVPALAVALPLFVAARRRHRPGRRRARARCWRGDLPAAGDPLTLELPAWGGGPAVVHVSVADVVFLAAYAAYAQRFALRVVASSVAMLRAASSRRSWRRSRSTAGCPRWRRHRRLPAANADRLSPLLAAPREG